MDIKVIDLTPRIGSEIRTDVDTLLSGGLSGEIRTLLEQRGVIAFREINLTDDQQVAFTRTLGTIVEEGQGSVTKITMDPTENDKAGYLRGAFFWHIDGTMQDVPVLASIMSARRLSAVGGETEFCNTYAAYDDLPQLEKAELDQLRVVHTLEATQRYVYPEPSYEMLQGWHRYADNERHRWTIGDLVIWDNTGTMHRALAYPLDSGRMMHRTKLQGEESFA